MKKQLINISFVQTAKLAAGMYLAISLPLFALAFVPLSLSDQLNGALGFMLVLGPLFYALMGFVGTLIAAWLYNLVASKTGGIEFTTVDVDAAR